MGESPEPLQVRVSPNGFVAQRMPISFNDKGHWLLTYVQDGQLAVAVYTDDEVSDWPRLVPAELGGIGGEWPVEVS